MSDAVSTAFLEGQGVPVALGDVEAELIRLWGPAATEVGGDTEGSPAVTRVVLANLIVECLDDSSRIAGVLETVMSRYPCRAIVLCRDDSLDRQIQAEASALCHLPAPGCPQVCSERIVLRTGRNAHDLLMGAVRPLIEPDLPLILWWTSAPTTLPELYRDLSSECSRVILDLPDNAPAGALALGLDRSIHSFSRDSIWFEITGWRELVAQLFDPSCLAGLLGQIAQVSIEVVAPAVAGPPRPGVWLAAWLAGQLGWRPVGAATFGSVGPDSRLSASFESPGGPVTVVLVARPSPALSEPRIASVIITCRDPGGESTLKLTRPSPLSPGVRIDVTSPDACRLPRVVDSPDPDPAQRIAAALDSARIDPPFDRALPIAMGMLGLESD